MTELFAALVALNISSGILPPLPEAVANNAVARVDVPVKSNTANSQGTQTYLLSFMGLGQGKGYQDVHNRAYKLALEDAQMWQTIKPVPSSITPTGRLAAIAVGVGPYAYLFGGYTVDAKHHEISTPDVYRYDVTNNRYERLADMPVPVDDAVALTYQDRYIYLISGWHMDGNVNLVQVYDTQKNRWQQASPYLAVPTFGHAASIIDNVIVVCDGVATVPKKDKRRGFEAVAQCRKGTINPNNPLSIDWRVIDHPTGKSRYRMASHGVSDTAVFFGGAHNPYNYNGIGYNGAPAAPTNEIWRYHVPTNSWQVSQSTYKSMDHRGLIPYKDALYVIGGMTQAQTVTPNVVNILAR